MIRPENLFLTKLINEDCSEAFNTLLKTGFSTTLFSKPYSDIVDYVVAYKQKFKQLPTKEEVVTRFAQLGEEIIFSPQIPKAALGAIYEEIVNQAVRTDVITYSEDLAKEFEAKSGLGLIEAISFKHRELSLKYAQARGKANSFADMVPALLEDYEKVVTGESDGIPIPFLFLQEAYHGWQPAQITSILAKTGIGKTWALMLNAIAAAEGDPFFFFRPPDIPATTPEKKKAQAKKVLVVSCEMPVLDIARRMAASYTKTSFNRLKAGKLSHEEKELYFRRMREMIGQGSDSTRASVGDNIRIVGPEMAGTPEQILAQAEDFGADLVEIDGFYYMNGPGMKRWEKVEANMQQMRLHTLISNKHYILASQFKRDARTIQGSSTDDAAFSVSIVQDSNNVIGLYQPRALLKAKQIDICELKARDGVPGVPYRYKWDLYDMIFEQIGQVQDSGEEDGY